MTGIVVSTRAPSALLALGRPPSLEDHDGKLEPYARALEQYLGRLVEALEIRSELVDKPGATQYTITNDTETRTIDADTITLPSLADVVCTVIKDIKI